LIIRVAFSRARFDPFKETAAVMYSPGAQELRGQNRDAFVLQQRLQQQQPEDDIEPDLDEGFAEEISLKAQVGGWMMRGRMDECFVPSGSVVDAVIAWEIETPGEWKDGGRSGIRREKRRGEETVNWCVSE